MTRSRHFFLYLVYKQQSASVGLMTQFVLKNPSRVWFLLRDTCFRPYSALVNSMDLPSVTEYSKPGGRLTIIVSFKTAHKYS